MFILKINGMKKAGKDGPTGLGKWMVVYLRMVRLGMSFLRSYLQFE